MPPITAALALIVFLAGAVAGSLGYFACGMIDGPEVRITGRVGWSACENMMSGVVVIESNAVTVETLQVGMQQLESLGTRVLGAIFV